MHELVVNLHMHTPYSDGSLRHSEIVRAAHNAGVDVVIVTDHNVWVQGPEDVYTQGDHRVLLLVGEEIHDQSRVPQKNHLLVFGAERELATFAHDTQLLLDSVKKANGLAFIAHPVDPAAPAVHQTDISWVDWDVQGITGIELWNGFSEFKSRLRSKLHAIYYAYNPRHIAHGPFPEILSRWDGLLTSGRRIPAIGGSDAHGLHARLGPLRRMLFPYEYHFRCINTHIYTPKPLSGDVEADRQAVLGALGGGCAFIGYDLPAPTNGFRFTAQGKSGKAMMGDEISANFGVTLQIHLPRATECRLIRDGKVVKTWVNKENCTHITSEPGVYRVEAYIQYLGKRRGWIFSNPIYVRP